MITNMGTSYKSFNLLETWLANQLPFSTVLNWTLYKESWLYLLILITLSLYEGWLYIVVTVRRHKIFARQGENVHCEIPITYTQATLGAELEIPMVDGSVEKYKIPEGTPSGTKFTIKNKGFKSVNGNWRGDFIFTITVQIPKKLTSEQRELLLKLARTMNEQPPVKKRGIFG